MNITSICNRLIALKFVPDAVQRYNEGRFDASGEIFAQRSYYINSLKKIVSDIGANRYLSKVMIERGTIKYRPSWFVVYLTLPSGNNIGEAEGICIVVDTVKRHAEFYIMEISVNNYAVCQIFGDDHIDYGQVESRQLFLKKSFELAAIYFDNIEPKDQPSKQREQYSKPKEQSCKPEEKPSKQYNNPAKKPRKSLTKLDSAALLFIILVPIILGGAYWGLSLHRSKSKSEPSKYSRIAYNDEGTDDSYWESNDDGIKEIDEIEDVDRYDAYSEDEYDYEVREPFDVKVPVLPSDYFKESKREETAPRINEPREVNEPRDIKSFSNGERPYGDWFGKDSYDYKSLSNLKISNQSDNDAVVLLCDPNDNVVRQAFVKSHSIYTMQYIPSVSAIMKTMMGKSWNSLKNNGAGYPRGGFEYNETYSISPWNNPFDFLHKYREDGVDYPTYSVTLHAVHNGNFKTSKSSKREFFK